MAQEARGAVRRHLELERRDADLGREVGELGLHDGRLGRQHGRGDAKRLRRGGGRLGLARVEAVGEVAGGVGLARGDAARQQPDLALRVDVQREAQLEDAARGGGVLGGGEVHRVERDVGDPQPGGPGGARGVRAARLRAQRDGRLHLRAAVVVERREERAEGNALHEPGGDARAVEAELQAPRLAGGEALRGERAEALERVPRGVRAGDVRVAPDEQRRAEGQAGVELRDGAVQLQRDRARRAAVVADRERAERRVGAEVEAVHRRDVQRAGPVRGRRRADEQHLAVRDRVVRVDRQARGRVLAPLAADAQQRAARQVAEAGEVGAGRDRRAGAHREAEVVEHLAALAAVPRRARRGGDADEVRRERPLRPAREVRVEAEADHARGDARDGRRLGVLAVPHEDGRRDEAVRPAVRRELARGEERGRVVDADRVDRPRPEDRGGVRLGRDLDVDGVPAGLERDALRGALRARLRRERAERRAENEGRACGANEGRRRCRRMEGAAMRRIVEGLHKEAMWRIQLLSGVSSGFGAEGAGKGTGSQP